MRHLRRIVLILASTVAFLLAVSKPRFIDLAWGWRILLGTVGLAAGWYELRLADAEEKRRALRHMAGREPRGNKEFGRYYFPPEEVEIAAKVRAIMARHVSVDLARLHPDDRIVEDVRMDALDSLATVEFVAEVEKEFGITIPNKAAATMTSLRSFVEYVSNAKKSGVS